MRNKQTTENIETTETDGIYNFEDNLSDSRIVEKPNTKVMYNIRQMSEYIKKIGRPLTESEAEKFIIEYEE